MIRTILAGVVALGALAVPIGTIGEPPSPENLEVYLGNDEWVTLNPDGYALATGGTNGDQIDIPEPYTWNCPLGCGAGGTAATQEDVDSAEYFHLLTAH